jgi:hypothetical protein
MISSLSARTLESITLRPDSAYFRPERIKTLSLQRQPPLTRLSRDRFHCYCRILFTRQVKTLISIALRRADLTTPFSIDWLSVFSYPLTAELIPKIPGNRLLDR